jgi:hypothetical protein
MFMTVQHCILNLGDRKQALTAIFEQQPLIMKAVGELASFFGVKGQPV